jgi:hypothetical protein
MTHHFYHYRFDPSLPQQELEDAFAVALMAVLSLHGEDRVCRDGRACLDPVHHTALIDASTAVGRDLARIFTGFVIQAYGERTPCIERLWLAPRAVTVTLSRQPIHHTV